MKINDRKMYKRILAIMLVILLVLPQGLSYIQARADGEDTSVSWDGTTLNVTYPDSVVLDDAISAKVVFGGNSVDSVPDTVDKFDLSAYKVREGTTFTFTIYGGVDEDEEPTIIADNLTSTCDSKNFTVTDNDVTGVIDTSSKTITISTSSEAIYLSDYATKAIAYKGTNDVGSVDFGDTNSVTLNYNDSAAVGKTITLKYYNGSDEITSGKEEFNLEWKSGDFEVVWEKDESEIITGVSISNGVNNYTGELNEFASDIVVKINGNEIARETTTSTTNNVSLAGKKINAGDVLSVELLSGGSDISGDILSNKSITSESSNCFEVSVNGDNAYVLYLGSTKIDKDETNEGKDIYKILKSETGNLSLSISGILFKSLSIDNSDVLSNTSFSNGTSTIELGTLDNYNVEFSSMAFSDILSETDANIYPHIPYKYSMNIPSYMNGKISVEISPVAPSTTPASAAPTISGSDLSFRFSNEPINAKYSLNIKSGDFTLDSLSMTIKIDDLAVVLQDAAYYYNSDPTKAIKACYTTIAGTTTLMFKQSVKAFFDFTNKNYTHYRVGETGEFSIIDNNKVELSISGTEEIAFAAYQDIENEGKFGVMRIVIDAVAPSFGVDGIQCQNFKQDGNTLTDKDSDLISADAGLKRITFTGVDNEGGSGIKEVFYSTEDLGEDYTTIINDNRKQGVNNSEVSIELNDPSQGDKYYYFYAVDNVGNVYKEQVKVGRILKIDVKFDSFSKSYNDYKDENDEYLKSGDKVLFTANGEVVEIADNKAELVGNGNNIDLVATCIKDEKEPDKWKISCVIPSDIDGKYTVKINVTNGVDTVPAESKEFTIDNTSPVILFNDLIANPNIKGIINKQDTAKSKIDVFKNVVEINAHKYNSTIKVVGESGKTQTGTEKEIKDLLDKGKYDGITIDEGKYSIAYTITDKAGNKTTAQTGYFIYDITNPATNGFTINKTSKNGQENEKYKDYQVFDSSKVKVTIKTEDLIAGLDDYSNQGIVVIADSVDKFGNSSNISNVQKEFAGNEYVGTYTFYINAKYRGKLSVKLKDKVGNETEYEIIKDGSKNGIIADDTHAKVTVTTPNVDKKDNNGVEYYNGSDKALARVETSDNISGLKTIKLSNVASAYKDNTIVDVGDKYNEDFSAKGGTITEDKTINAVYTKDGVYQIKATVVDNAGNSFENKSDKFVIDTTKPAIQVTYDSSKEYNNQTVNAKIKIIELNINSEKSKITIYRNESEYSSKAASNDNNVSFEEDGDYYIKVHAVDYAGNEFDYDGKSKGEIFTVDKTNPKLTLTFNNNDVRNDRYYNAERIGTLTVEEHNFDASRVDVKVSVTDSAEGVGTPSIGGFSSSGDTHTASIPFSQDATYEITVSATDQAENNADQTITESFIVDLTEPEIAFSNVEENALYADIIRPDVEVTDRNYDQSGTTITLVSTRDNGVAAKSLEDSYTVSAIANGERFAYSNFKKEESSDDYYSLKAVATDLAGNSSEKTIGFMVNRFGSFFTLNDYTSQLVEDVYTNLEGEEDIEIAAHNLSDIKESLVYFTVGEDTKTLTENDGYKVSTKTGDDHWNVSTYTFDKTLFESEGEYNIVVSTKDAEGNVADNETKEKPVSFTIDRTAPEYFISGVEDGQNYEDQDKVSAIIELHDNIGVAKADITIDGDKKSYEGKELDDMNYSVPQEFTKGTHTVEVKVYDLAGNVSEDDGGIKFSVNQSVAERAIKNFWWIFVIIGVVIIGGAIFFVASRRRNEE